MCDFVDRKTPFVFNPQRKKDLHEETQKAVDVALNETASKVCVSRRPLNLHVFAVVEDR